MQLSRILIIMALCLPMIGQAKQKKVIGGIDSRLPSNKSGVARVSMLRSLPGGCTATLIGKSCMISAGHCIENLKIVEFNTRGTNSYGKLNETNRRDIFKVDTGSIKSYFKKNEAEDWVVFRVKKKNLVSGKEQGRIQGWV